MGAGEAAEEAAEAARRFYEAWNRRDLEATFETVDPDVVLDWSDSIAPYSGVFTGKEGCRRLAGELQDAWEYFHVEIVEIVDAGDGRVVVRTHVRGRGQGSGIEIDAGGAVLCAARDGKLLAAKLFQTEEAALAAASDRAGRRG